MEFCLQRQRRSCASGCESKLCCSSKDLCLGPASWLYTSCSKSLCLSVLTYGYCEHQLIPIWESSLETWKGCRNGMNYNLGTWTRYLKVGTTCWFKFKLWQRAAPHTHTQLSCAAMDVSLNSLGLSFHICEMVKITASSSWDFYKDYQINVWHIKVT